MRERVAIRIFQNGAQLGPTVEETWDEAALAEHIPHVAARHMELAARLPFPIMIEIEFLDEPDENQRFFRIGTDPRGMRDPLQIHPPATERLQ